MATESLSVASPLRSGLFLSSGFPIVPIVLASSNSRATTYLCDDPKKSEGLADAEVELKGTVYSLASIQWKSNIEAQGAYRSVIPNAGTYRLQ